METEPHCVIPILNVIETEAELLTFTRDPYVVALRSVTLPTHPATEDVNRGEVLCAGFTIYEVSSSVAKVSEC